MTSAEIRQAFLSFFEKNAHQIVRSSSLVPANDPTLLFTNAGMVQFKDVFLGAEKRPYNRAVTSQRCLRAGGKHNDLDQVGYTARHHTFFEMLGNFSFGDYFKREAIEFAWQFLTETAGLEPERLWVTVFEEDDEAADLWTDHIGVPKARLARIGAKDNFWAMGDTGPCGPCTEIFYDHGPAVAGGPPGTPEEDGDRYIEVWNLVFMQFDRDASGQMLPLPKPCVDTGMGLERLAAVLQGKHNNYEIDLFTGLIEAAGNLTHAADLKSNSLKVIADHVRACAFLIADGVLPSNEGRGYVLRRIIRRAIRHGYKLGQSAPFFHAMVAPLVKEMGEAYPELAEKSSFVESVLLQEEHRFAETLEQGMRVFEQVVANLQGNEIPGEDVFKLYDTYGFPADLTADVARERELTIDGDGFQAHMQAQRERARASSRFETDNLVSVEVLSGLAETEFLGYEHSTGVRAQVLTLLDGEGNVVDSLDAGESGGIILNQTPFYAESGGQVGDRGILSAGGFKFEVEDTAKLAGAYHLHRGQVKSGDVSTGAEVQADIDEPYRRRVMLNHSATHLLHAALREVLGDHVQQKGSLVADNRLRFDFSNHQPVSVEQLATIERLVNEQIRFNESSDIKVMAYDDALNSGAMALFGEKYGDEVRVLRFGDFSVELCGGTHVKAVGEIGLFKIVSESGIAAGVRRIEAVTGEGALDWVDEQSRVLGEAANVLKTGSFEVAEKVSALLARSRELEKELAGVRAKMAQAEGDELLDKVTEIQGVKLLAAVMAGADSKTLRESVDRLKSKLGSAVVVLAAEAKGKVAVVAGVTQDLVKSVKAGEVANHVSEAVGGRGGGRPDMAQGGGPDVSAMESSIDDVAAWLESRLKS